MGLKDKMMQAAKSLKAEAVLAKAELDSKKQGYNPDDYAGFDGEGKPLPDDWNSNGGFK